MASPNQVFKQFAIPPTSQLPGFLATCPALTGLELAELEPLAGEVTLVRYADGTRFFTDTTPDHRTPLRFVVHGRASWDSNRGSEQKSAWMMSQGSVFGLEGLNDWARRNQLGQYWDRGEPPRIRCQAIGPLWVLELAPERFEPLFTSEPGKPIFTKLIERVATCIYSPDAVAAMRKTPLFSRAAPVHLYKLLEWAPTNKILPVIWDPNQGDMPDMMEGPTAVYYVIEGELKMTVDAKEKTIGAGEIDGADLFGSPEDSLGVSTPTPVGDTSAITVTKDMLQTCIRTMPGFARSLGPRSESSSKGEP